MFSRVLRNNDGKNAQKWHTSFNFTNVSDYATIKDRTFGRAQELKILVNHKKSICELQERRL